ncbi:putative mitochondrial protein, conserved [Tulasnella sp. 424]|nr:putative mitochondrial protein, conserved [Tulasnella sp. 424]KAG8973589.1 putative mitochondrial protein, conserved [Tulasnella sp. 425]
MTSLLQSLRATATRSNRVGTRSLSSSLPVYRNVPNFNRPGPPPLPAEDQKEFEELVRKAQAPLSGDSAKAAEGVGQLDVKTVSADGDLVHPDARPKPSPDFVGDVNPETGEQGGPKKNPLNWGADGEWTYGGRAVDF